MHKPKLSTIITASIIALSPFNQNKERPEILSENSITIPFPEETKEESEKIANTIVHELIPQAQTHLNNHPDKKEQISFALYNHIIKKILQHEISSSKLKQDLQENNNNPLKVLDTINTILIPGGIYINITQLNNSTYFSIHNVNKSNSTNLNLESKQYNIRTIYLSKPIFQTESIAVAATYKPEIQTIVVFSNQLDLQKLTNSLSQEFNLEVKETNQELQKQTLELSILHEAYHHHLTQNFPLKPENTRILNN